MASNALWTRSETKADTCVTTGYAIIGKTIIKNPRNANQTLEVDEVKMYIDGELVYQGGDTYWAARDRRHLPYPEILGEGNTTIDGIQYRPGLNGTPVYCGRKDAKQPVYKWVLWRITEKQYEQWAITYQFANEILEAYGIERQEFVKGNPSRWGITKWEINRTKPEKASTSLELVRSRKDDQAEDDDDNGRNITGVVKLYHYERNDVYAWEIVDPGRGYEVGEPVSIGKGLGLKTKVTAIIVDDVELDPNPGWGDLVKTDQTTSRSMQSAITTSITQTPVAMPTGQNTQSASATNLSSNQTLRCFTMTTLSLRSAASN